MSTDKEQDYFCYGIAEDILNELTHLEGLHVVARTSSFAVKDKNQGIREIGRKLGAHTMVEGSVRKARNRLRITAQLINVEEDTHLWSETYDREMKDVFVIQDEISKAVVKSLEVKLLGEPFVEDSIDSFAMKFFDIQSHFFIAVIIFYLPTAKV